MMELASTEVRLQENVEGFRPNVRVLHDTRRKDEVEGKILKKFNMRQHDEQIEKHGKLCQERMNKDMKKTRQIKVIDNDKGGTFMRLMPPPKDIKKKPVPKAVELKRTRRDRGEMEEIIFKLFEPQPNWTLKNLIAETEQPEQFSKDMLKDLFAYNKGANQGTYELKARV